MKLLIALCIVATVVAAPPYDDIQVLRYDNDKVGTGGYRYYFELSDGTIHEQQGELSNEGRDDASIAVKGTYSWIAPNGIKYTVTYTADKEGYNSEIKEEDGGPGNVPPSVLATLIGR